MEEKEIRKLEQMAREIFGCAYDDLDLDDQDMLYCMMMEGEQE